MSLSDLIHALLPEDGASLSNPRLLALLRAAGHKVTEAAYAEARDRLVAEGRAARGKGRGGSVYRADVAALDLAQTVPGDRRRTRPAKSAPPEPRPRLQDPPQVLSYRHGETRVNNPEVGMVNAGTDPDAGKTRWAHDPHLDPVLNFDSARAGIERLIDDALASKASEQSVDAVIGDIGTRLIAMDPLWDGLFPAEQARIVALLVELVDIGKDGLNVRLRVDGRCGLARDMLAGDIEAAA